MINHLTNFFKDYEFENLLEHCNDDGLRFTGNGDEYAIKQGDYLDFAKDKCDTMFIEYGYDTSNTIPRLQKTMPHVEYKCHNDFMGKRIALIIYLIGNDGTIFYETAVRTGQSNNVKGINPEQDTFIPNNGYWFDNHEKQLYHSYENTQDTPRWIFMYNVMQLREKYVNHEVSNEEI